MDSIVTENNNSEERPTAQIQIQVSGTGETQMVTLPLSMATAITAQGSQISANQQSSAGQAPSLQDTAKRRELLSRRPSYRKILNELSGQPEQRVKDEPGGENKSSEGSESDSGSQVTSMHAPTIAYQTGSGTVTVHQSPQTIQIAAPVNHDQNSVTSVSGLQTFSMANALAQGQPTLVQGDTGAGGNTLWMPANHVVVQGSDSQMYQIRTPTSSAALPSVVIGGNSMQSPQQMAEEASRKRELRLMKNREAAKECRRRKKEYVKCLETRVAVLENQNKQLIDELKTLKELYVHKQVD
ncbi:cyclic AMP-responsive element-binding protein 1-like isoform X1 [Clavelina lepadiformis]|uniref:cyclic AMP-responsive element-binding protein 1-like isoform X1 n=1 Tax=Clavelina lepadiformis TaxID=159417 RepID=UPI0040427102